MQQFKFRIYVPKLNVQNTRVYNRGSNFLANEFNANSYGYNGCNLTEHSGTCTVYKVIFCPV